MISSQWRKVLADLWGNKVRSALMLLTISVSVFAVGFIITTGDLSMRDMDADFAAANGHSAIIYTAPSQDLKPSLRRVPGVAQVEQRSSVSARWVVAEETYQPIEIVAIPPVDEIQIDRLTPVYPPTFPVLRDRQVLLASSALQVLDVDVGDAITVELANKKRRTLTVAGTAHDVYAISPMFGGSALAYASPATIEWLGGTRDFTQVYLTVSENPSDRDHVTAVAQAAADKIRDAGVEVGYTFIYNPGRHFAKDIFQGILMILYILGGMTVFLSTFLVVNIINALLSQHIRFIGVMKAIGGQRGQIIARYLALVLCLGAAALLLTSWLAALAGYATVRMMGSMLNFVVGPFRLSPQAVTWQAVIALGVPILAALSPVWNGTRITVREAISSYGLGQGASRKGRGDPADRVESLVERAAFLSRPLLLSLRNTFGRKARLALTLITLTLAGAVFISVFNLWASFGAGIAEVQKYYLANVSVDFAQSYNMSKVASLVGGAPGIARIEGWDSLLARILSPDEEKELEILLIAPPGDSALIDPTITSGRWLLPSDENAIVIGNHILKERPGLKVGDSLVIEIGEKETSWVIVGTFRLVGNFNPPPAYVNNEYLARLLNRQGKVSMLRIITSPPDGAAEARAANALETIFKQNNLQISNLQQGEVWRQQQATSFNVMIYFLLVMAALIAVVGGLGLAGTMSMNVLERSREIGVLRAVGAGNGSILRMVLVEVSLIGLISWALALVLSIPITYALDVGVGMAVFTMPIDFLLVIDGVIYWLAGILGISMLAGALPAGNAMRLTIREVLAYE